MPQKRLYRVCSVLKQISIDFGANLFQTDSNSFTFTQKECGKVKEEKNLKLESKI